LPLIYAHVFDEINHYVWSPERDNERQEVVLIVDEFFYMKSVPLMEEEIVRATKTGRGRQFGVVTADQDVPTYWGEASGDNGAMLVGNARQKFIFQTNEQAPTLERHYQGVLDPRQVQTMRTLRRGHCVAMLDNEIRTLRIDLLPHEARSLLR
jgi:hypothetical protein